MARRLINNCPRLTASQVLALRMDTVLHASLTPATRVTFLVIKLLLGEGGRIHVPSLMRGCQLRRKYSQR